VTKQVQDAFQSTGLKELLRERKVRRLVIVGMATDQSVSSTARTADNCGVLDYGRDGKGEVVVIEDATAAWQKPDGRWDAETVHAIHLESLKAFGVDIESTTQVLEEVERLAVAE
jgi:nicotinamidase-related amidase